MSDGLHIRWRETAPDRGLLTFALAEIDVLHHVWPETLQCNIVIERLSATAGRGGICAAVELKLGHSSPQVQARACGVDAYQALRGAFADLRRGMPPYLGSLTPLRHRPTAAAGREAVVLNNEAAA